MLFIILHRVVKKLESMGAFHLSELTGQTIPVAMIISLSIKTLPPDQSNS